MRSSLDQTDRALLDVLQREIPLVERPFAQIGRELGLGEEDVLRRTRALKSAAQPVIRQISAIFDSRTLGYQSSLVACRVDEDQLDQAVRIINDHPGVSHNYRRNSTYNLWYTVAVPPDSRFGLHETVDILHDRSGARATRLMPSLKLFKIGVKFDMSGDLDPIAQRDSGARYDFTKHGPAFVSERDKTFIRLLQQDLPLVERPFESWAAWSGLSERDVIDAAKRYLRDGWMRRFSAVLRHRAAGFGANAMGVWCVPENQIDTFGTRAAGFEAVSHCYQRPAYPDWRYNLYTMVHAPTSEECDSVLAAIAEATGVGDYGALYSSTEYKKVRVRYFAGDIEAWEERAMSDCVHELMHCGAD